MARPEHQAEHPLHVTLRARVNSLRKQVVFEVVRGAISRTNRARGEHFRICEFSVQSNHVHLLIEAEDRDALLSGMRALCVRIARAVNRVLGRRGKLIDDRWHGRALETSRSVRRALVYVLANFKKHGPSSLGDRPILDLRSSAPYFRGFFELGGEAPCESQSERVSMVVKRLAADERPVAEPRTWLLSTGWRLHQFISCHEAPRRAV
ncbi:MAG: hypothetical protein ACOY0T_24815 [Myxococcota bacterium]